MASDLTTQQMVASPTTSHSSTMLSSAVAPAANTEPAQELINNILPWWVWICILLFLAACGCVMCCILLKWKLSRETRIITSEDGTSLGRQSVTRKFRFWSRGRHCNVTEETAAVQSRIEVAVTVGRESTSRYWRSSRSRDPESAPSSTQAIPMAVAGCEAYTPGNRGSWVELASSPARPFDRVTESASLVDITATRAPFEVV